MKWAHFNRFAGLAYVINRDGAVKYSMDGEGIRSGPISLKQTQINFLLSSDYIERRLVGNDEEIFHQLERYYKQRKASTLVDFLGIAQSGDIVPDNIIKHIIPQQLVNDEEYITFVFESLCAMKDPIISIQLLSNLLNSFTNGLSLCSSVINKYPEYESIKKISKAWRQIVYSMGVDQTAAYYKASNMKFFNLLYDECVGNHNPTRAYIDYNLLMQDSSNSNDPIKFFNMFSRISLQYQRLRIKYTKAINKDPINKRYRTNVQREVLERLNLEGEKCNDSINFQNQLFAQRIYELEHCRTQTAKSDEVSRAIQEHLDGWNTIFGVTSRHLSDCISDFYMDKTESLPRISVKFLISDQENGYLKVFFRNHVINYEEISSVNDYSSLLFAIKTGNMFQDNHLPASYVGEIYQNPRIIPYDKRLNTQADENLACLIHQSGLQDRPFGLLLNVQLLRHRSPPPGIGG